MSIRLQCDRPGCSATAETEWWHPLVCVGPALNATVELPAGWAIWTAPTFAESEVRCPEHARKL